VGVVSTDPDFAAQWAIDDKPDSHAQADAAKARRLQAMQDQSRASSEQLQQEFAEAFKENGPKK